jgi:hypothetical protein
MKQKKVEKERQNESAKLRYTLIDDDVIEIPKVSFDITTNFSSLENVRSENKHYRINTAKQRITFYLNEKGVEITSEGEAEITFFEPPAEGEIKPKKMLFNKPFFIMLKRTDNINPYFASWIANAELLTH